MSNNLFLKRMNGNMELTERVKKCQKDVQSIKASQLLGESNYVIYTYTESHEATLSSGQSPTLQATFKTDEDAFSIINFELKFYINGQLETFTDVSHLFGWMYHGAILPNAEYEYTISQWGNNVNIGKAVCYFSEDSAYGEHPVDWNGKRVRYELFVKSSRPGKLTVQW